MLASLEQLEPLLAAMPASTDLQGELQEEACEAYGRLRTTLLEAAELPHANAVTVPGDQSLPSRQQVPFPCEAGRAAPQPRDGRLIDLETPLREPVVTQSGLVPRMQGSLAAVPPLPRHGIRAAAAGQGPYRSPLG
eukprot:TRINITY_DN34998_c0_g2_i1.p1 TRINITY_DN34998_c0_g2~~TRINITY_DN34998_c0_g2_i1.p1  ORF type:complete len:154 (+),score=31.26 TRINITY_DN34998_c0_g2_i1:57-464(+)